MEPLFFQVRVQSQFSCIAEVAAEFGTGIVLQPDLHPLLDYPSYPGSDPGMRLTVLTPGCLFVSNILMAHIKSNYFT